MKKKLLKKQATVIKIKKRRKIKKLPEAFHLFGVGMVPPFEKQCYLKTDSKGEVFKQMKKDANIAYQIIHEVDGVCIPIHDWPAWKVAK